MTPFSLFRMMLMLVVSCILMSGLQAKTTKQSESDKPVTIIVTYTLNGKEKALVTEIIGKLIAEARGEPGVLEYDAYRYIEHPRQIVFIERWVNHAAHIAHHKRPQIIQLHKALKPYLMYEPRFDRLYAYSAFINADKRWQEPAPVSAE